MTRKCHCAGGCGPQADGVTRREFITLVGVGAAGALLAQPGLAQENAPPVAADALAQWKQGLRKPSAPPPVYRSGIHTDARMPLGGIGTGTFEIGADGQLTTWQLFNTLRDGSLPLFFAVRVGQTARLLQTSGGPEVPRVPEIEMTGQYPVADLRFRDPALPVDLTLSAFTPLTPLDAPLSSLPVAAFVFRIHNPTAQTQTVSLAALMQNPVGYDAMGQARVDDATGFNRVPERLTVEHPNFGANVNEVSREGAATVLSMRAEPSPVPQLAHPLHLYTNANPNGLNAFAGDRPEALTVQDVDHLPETSEPFSAPALAIIWLEAAPADFPEETLGRVREAVAAGALLVFSGKTLPLVQAYQDARDGQDEPLAATPPDIVYEDFEDGYGRWIVEGAAFGTKPAAGTLDNQQPVSGFAGKGLVNSFRGGDDATGRLISRPFTIERRFIRFLVGGGDYPKTQIRLVVGGKTVRAASGRNDERLLPAQWDVRDVRGQTAHIEIVDEQTGPWGHISVDQIEFSDLPMSRAVFGMLRDLLGAGPTRPANAFGQGKVLVLDHPLLDPAEAELIGARQKAYAALAALAGIEYAAPRSVPATAPGFGTLALAALGPDATALTAFDAWQDAWRAFAAQGRFAPISQTAPNAPTPPGRTVNGALASTLEVAPGATVEAPFLLTWRYPNKYNEAGVLMGNHYAQAWPDALAVARDAAARFGPLRDETEQFRRTLYASTLPVWLLDCLSSQISTIRHIGVVFRIANGDIYGWEGSNGCCEPTCTHVWGYEQTLAHLFPALEREMRRIDFEHQQEPDGGINNRTDVPSPPHPSGEHPFSDGHASTILKAYREALNSPDNALLHRYWPHVKSAVEYLIARDAATSGGEPDGTLSDAQWNTYDNAIHGVNSFIGTYYLAALRAGEEMGRRAGDAATAQRFRAIFELGQKNLTARCWNGEYFQQDLPDYAQRSGEYGPGCLSDQMIGQWWAHQLGLGYLLPQEHVRAALRAIFQYNWRTDFTHFEHNWRKFAGGADKGLLICTWPKGGRPANTIPYVDEVWTGVEYQVAAHMIYEGLIDEGFAVVKGARDRYDGVPRPPIPRNPWNEIECGGHYARAMSSWSLLLALSGFGCDGPAQTLRFAPRTTPNNFQSLFTGPEGWGSVRQVRRGKTQRSEVQVVAGRLAVARLYLAAPPSLAHARVMLGREVVPAALTHHADGGVLITLSRLVSIKPGADLSVVLS